MLVFCDFYLNATTPVYVCWFLFPRPYYMDLHYKYITRFFFQIRHPLFFPTTPHSTTNNQPSDKNLVSPYLTFMSETPNSPNYASILKKNIALVSAEPQSAMSPGHPTDTIPFLPSGSGESLGSHCFFFMLSITHLRTMHTLLV